MKNSERVKVSLYIFFTCTQKILRSSFLVTPLGGLMLDSGGVFGTIKYLWLY